MKMKELSNHQRSILQTLTFSSLSLRAPMEPASSRPIGQILS